MRNNGYLGSRTLEIARSERSETSIQQGENLMKLPSHRSGIVVAAIALVAALASAPILHAQYGFRRATAAVAASIIAATEPAGEGWRTAGTEASCASAS